MTARKVPKAMPVRAALDASLKALAELGRLEPVDAALVALCKSTADAVDTFPARSSLVKEYRECLLLLSGLGARERDGLDELLAALRSPVGDETKP